MSGAAVCLSDYSVNDQVKRQNKLYCMLFARSFVAFCARYVPYLITS